MLLNRTAKVDYTLFTRHPIGVLANEMSGLGEVSILTPDRNWSASGHVKTLVRPLRVKQIQANTLLNVNIPFLAEDQIRGFQVTRQGLRVYHDKLDRRLDPRGKPYYWTAGDLPTVVPERGTDIGALAGGFVSITPVQLDLTAYHTIPDLNAWEWATAEEKADYKTTPVTALAIAAS